MVAIMIPLTSEKVQGVLDDATYTATLCMARDGKHFFFSAISVDGAVVNAPNKRWNSRQAAMHALADIAAANRNPDGAVDASPFLGLTDDLLFLTEDLLIADTEPESVPAVAAPEPLVELASVTSAGKTRSRRKAPPAH